MNSRACCSEVDGQNHGTQSLIETLGSMVIFDENQAVSDINNVKAKLFQEVTFFIVIFTYMPAMNI